MTTPLATPSGFPGRLRALGHRLYADYLMPARFEAYRQLLTSALAAGYRFESIEAHWARRRAGEVGPGEKVFILRHDIDSDIAAGGRLFAIEAELGIRSSYYFRLGTLDRDLMARIHAQGSEVGYHYEELATLIKEKGLRSRAEAVAHLPEATARFEANLRRLRTEFRLPIRVVASHGDFANRALDIPNWVLLEDPATRARLGIDLEVYDAAFMDAVTFRSSDVGHPRYWKPADPREAIAAGSPLIYLLVHPRHWRSHFVSNTRENWTRVWEGFLLSRRQRRPERA